MSATRQIFKVAIIVALGGAFQHVVDAQCTRGVTYGTPFDHWETVGACKGDPNRTLFMDREQNAQAIIECQSGAWKSTARFSDPPLKYLALGICGTTAVNVDPTCAPWFDGPSFTSYRDGKVMFRAYSRDATWDPNQGCLTDPTLHSAEDGFPAEGCCGSFCSDPAGCQARGWVYDSGSCSCNPPPPPPPCAGFHEQCLLDSDCCESLACVSDGFSGGWCADPPNCPLLFNPDEPVYKLTSANEGVDFDFFGTGVLRRLAWTVPNTASGWLAYDRNGNGVVDNGAELLGTAFVKTDGRRATNGFDALRDLDGASGSDGVFDSSDAAFGRVLMWLDRNHDGVCGRDEAVRLNDLGVVAIYLAYEQIGRRDEYGNLYRLKGTAVVRRGERQVQRQILDVILVDADRRRQQ